MLLTVEQLTDRLYGYRRSRFRMETLPAYAVTSDGDDFHRWLRGEREPDWSRKQPWLDHLRAEHAAGKSNSRVRILTNPLTDYERYSCEWGYALNAEAGEDIRVLRHGEHDVPPLSPEDWWLVDDDQVIEMRYDNEGRFLGGYLRPPHVAHVYRAKRDVAWEAAEPFTTWWERHPELHRKVAA